MHGGDPELYRATALRRVRWAEELDAVRPLFQDYRGWIADHRDPTLDAQPRVEAGLALLDRLVAELPGAYGPPSGDVILAVRRGSIVACGALREIEPGVGEIKRIYVRPDHRGPGFGPILTGAVLDRARELGYARVRVDTLGSMVAAIEFYQAMGFRPIPSYWPHPAPGARFFEYRFESPKRRDRSAAIHARKRSRANQPPAGIKGSAATTPGSARRRSSTSRASK
jgi:putative acetyltransferase